MEIECFGYSRKSPDDKEDTERSIKNQNELIETICKGKEWKLKEIFSDKNLSGGDRERQGANQCIKESRKYKVSNPRKEIYIVVKDQDRFARDSSFLRDTLKDLEAYGVRVFSIIKNDFLDYKDLGDSVMSLMNEQMIIEGRKKAILTRDKKIDQKLPCIPSPFGYKYYRKSWVVKKKESQIVLGVVENYLNSIDYKATMREFGITRGKYDRIIKNAKKGLYSGFCVFDNKFKASDGKPIRTEEVRYEIKVEKIVSEELFNKVNR